MLLEAVEGLFGVSRAPIAPFPTATSAACPMAVRCFQALPGCCQCLQQSADWHCHCLCWTLSRCRVTPPPAFLRICYLLVAKLAGNWGRG